MAFADTLDYSPLHQPVTDAEIKSYQAQLARGGQGPSFGVIMIVFGGVLTLLVLGSIISSGNIGNVFNLFPVAIVWGVIYGVYRLLEYQKAAAVRLYKFATRNSLSLQTDVHEPNFAGVVFNQGYSRKVTQMIRLQDGSEIGNYQYTQGSGKNRTDSVWGFARVPLARNLPNMILDARMNNILGRLSNLPLVAKDSSMLELEGDFSKYFTLHVPKGYERDALYIFTPDVMQALVDKGARYDIEIIDNYAVFYRQQAFSLDSEAELRDVFGTLELISNELRDQTKRYSDERVTASVAGNVVADSGVRLRAGRSRLAIAVGVISALMFFVHFIIQALFIFNVSR